MQFIYISLVLLAFPGGAILGWGQQRNQSGVKIGTNYRQLGVTGPTNVRGGSGIKIGSTGKSHRNYSKPTIPPPLTTPPPPPQLLPPQAPPQAPPQPTSYSSSRLPMLNVGLVVPQKSFGLREYNRAVSTAVTFLNRTGSRTRQLSVFQRHQVQFHMVMNSLTPTPTGMTFAISDFIRYIK